MHLEVVEAEREEEEKQPTLHSPSMEVLLLGRHPYILYPTTLPPGAPPGNHLATTWPPADTHLAGGH